MKIWHYSWCTTPQESIQLSTQPWNSRKFWAESVSNLCIMFLVSKLKHVEACWKLCTVGFCNLFAKPDAISVNFFSAIYKNRNLMTAYLMSKLVWWITMSCFLQMRKNSQLDKTVPCTESLYCSLSILKVHYGSSLCGLIILKIYIPIISFQISFETAYPLPYQLQLPNVGSEWLVSSVHDWHPKGFNDLTQRFWWGSPIPDWISSPSTAFTIYPYPGHDEQLVILGYRHPVYVPILNK